MASAASASAALSRDLEQREKKITRWVKRLKRSAEERQERIASGKRVLPGVMWDRGIIMTDGDTRPKRKLMRHLFSAHENQQMAHLLNVEECRKIEEWKETKLRDITAARPEFMVYCPIKGKAHNVTVVGKLPAKERRRLRGMIARRIKVAA